VAAARAYTEFFDALAAPFCLGDAAPSLQANRQGLSWPDDAVAAAAAAAAAATATFGFTVKDEYWLPVGSAATLITVHDHLALHKILNFVTSGGSSSSSSDDLYASGPKYLAGSCFGARAPNSIKAGQPFLVIENGIDYDDDFSSLAAIATLLQLTKQEAKHWHAPVFNNSLCVSFAEIVFISCFMILSSTPQTHTLSSPQQLDGPSSGGV
jgi:hypothetical protein